MEIGRYRVIGELGRGGYGSVYEAVDRDDGQTVALKIVRSTGREQRESMRREIRALASLSHPGVVAVRDYGAHEGAPWYAMDLVRGRRLRDLMPGGAAPSAPSTLALGRDADVTMPLRSEPMELALPRRSPPADPLPALAALRVLCDVLAYVHGEGVVHRDLKPENVILGADALPVLVDFGLVARSGGREALSVELSVEGTAAYMSPEQCRGDAVDARSDMYALGCLLFEALAGAPPFRDVSPVQTIMRHISEPPPRLSAMASGIPAEVDDLVLQLLAKEPAERVGHASVVGTALSAAFGLRGAPAGWPRPRAYLYRPALAGRAQELRVLDGFVARASRGAGGVVLLAGESGVGKTRVANEAAQRALRLGALVLAGSCEPHGSELHPIPLRAIAESCRERGAAEVQRVFGGALAILAPHEPALAELVPDVPPPASLPPALHRRRLNRALLDVLLAVGGRSPLLLLLDDLTSADVATASFVEELVHSRSLESTRVLMVGIARSEEPAPWIDGLAAGLQRIPVGRLDEDDLARLVTGMLASDADPGIVRFLVGASQGNPLFAAEYLRSCVDAGILDRDRRGAWRLGEDARSDPASTYQRLPLPSSLGALLSRRLAELSPGARALVELAALLTPPIDADVLRQAAAVDEGGWDAALEELLRREVLLDLGRGALGFSREKLREVAREALELPRKRALHRRLGEALESSGGVGREPAAGEIGRQWEGAAEPLRAARAYEAAGRRAAERFAMSDARRCFEAGLACLPADDPRRPDLVGALIEAMRRTGDSRSALALLQREIGARAHGPEARARLLASLGSTLYSLGRMTDARDAWTEADQLALQCGAAQLRGTVSGNLGVLAHEAGDMETAMALYEQALAFHRHAGNQAMVGLVLGNVASLHQQQGRHAEAELRYEEALEAVRSGGPSGRAFEGHTLSNLAVVHLERGRLPQAEALFEAALAIHKEIGDLLFEGITLQNLAQTYEEQGRLDAAEEMLRRALERHRRNGDRSNEGATLTNLGSNLLAKGRHPEARALATEALALLREVGNPRFEAITEGLQGSISLADGMLADAAAALERAVVALAAFGDRRVEAIVRLELATARRRQGLHDLAERELALAEGPLAEIGSPLELVAVDCGKGHLDLCRGGDGTAHLRRAEGRVAGMPLRPEALASRYIAALARAAAAHARGEPLQHGDAAPPEG